MPLFLSEQDWDELWNEGRQTGTIIDYADEFETGRRGYCPQIGTVHDWWMPLQNGLVLCVYDYNLVNPLRLTTQNYDLPWSVLSFFVAGNSRTILHGLTDYVDESVGYTYLSCCANTPESEDWAAQQMLRVQVCFNPPDFLKHFSLHQVESLPIEIRQAAFDKNPKPYYYLGTMTPMMQTVVHQILCCPYRGLMKRFYLESKALELIALQFCQFQENKRTARVSALLKSDDIERIHHARDILIKNFNNPPSLLELARQVAMNDHKLKQGFHQVFGTTVFGYLHNYRLEEAKHLLAIGEKVIDVVHKIGFADRSHFAAAFRKKFGLNPSEFSKQQRGNVKML